MDDEYQRDCSSTADASPDKRPEFGLKIGTLLPAKEGLESANDDDFKLGEVATLEKD